MKWRQTNEVMIEEKMTLNTTVSNSWNMRNDNMANKQWKRN